MLLVGARPQVRPTRPWFLRTRSGLSWHRELLGFGVGAAALTGLTVIFVTHRASVHSSTALALYLLAVVAVAAIGGHKPAVLAALVAPLLTNWFLLEPLHTWQIHENQDLISVLVFVAVAMIVSSFVAEAARRAVEAERARGEAQVLARLAGTGGADPLRSIAEHLLVSFELDRVSVLRTNESGDAFTVETRAGGPGLDRPDQATFSTYIDDRVILAVQGRPLADDDHRVLEAFTRQLSKALTEARLTAAAARAEVLDQADALRTAMLQSVSHDLRTPLAGIKASVSSLRQTDVEWPDDIRADFLETIENETDRLTSIVTNLLDLSRLQAGVLRPFVRDVPLEEVVPAALYSLGLRSLSVDLDLPDDLCEVATDQALMERVVANLVANALNFSPEGRRVSVEARDVGEFVELRVVDHGPGIGSVDKSRVLQPFHRLNDAVSPGGLGLGLAIADGLSRAIGSRLDLLDTPGGGLTAVVSIPRVGTATQVSP